MGFGKHLNYKSMYVHHQTTMKIKITAPPVIYRVQLMLLEGFVYDMSPADSFIAKIYVKIEMTRKSIEILYIYST
jgi:hypothetical protein